MAFSTIPSADIEVGKPTKKDLFQKIKDNDDDLNTRVGNVESGAAKVSIVNDIVFNASRYSANAQITSLVLVQADRSFTFTEAVISSGTAGTSGSFEMDVLKASTKGGTYSSVLSTKPSIGFAAGDDASSTNAVFSTTAVTQGDWIRIDITALQAPANNFHIKLIGEVS